MPDTPPFGNDVLSALQTLLKYIKFHIHVLVIGFILFKPHDSLREWTKLFPSDTSAWSLLLVLAIYGGYLRVTGLEIHNVLPSATISTVSDPAASPIELRLALSRICKAFESCFKASLLVWLSYRVYYTFPISLSFSRAWPFFFAPFGLAITGYFSPTTRFYGPIRFGYLEYSQHFTQAYNVLVDWLVVIAVLVTFLPFPWPSFAFGIGFTALCLIASFCVLAWVRLVFSYRKSLRAIASEVAMENGRARAAKTAACDEACSFSRYEDQVMQAAASARRDAILSNAVRVTDFFDCTTRAWAALGQVKQPVQTAAEKADVLVGAATDALDTDMPDEDAETGESHLEPQAQELQDNAEEALKRAKDVVSQLEVAQEAIDRSIAANAQDVKARAAAETNAITVTNTARSISNKAAGLLVAKTAIERHADEVSVLAGQALSAAQGGEMARAREIAKRVKTAADSADAALVVVRAARAEALENLLQWLGSSRTGGS